MLQALWACKQTNTLQKQAPELLPTILGAIEPDVDAFDASQLTMMIRDFAALGIKPGSGSHP